jgi:hypothetical protein
MKVFCTILMLTGFLSVPASGDNWTFEGFLGTAWNLPTSLKIVQEGNPNIKLTAHYKEHSFEGFPYYTLRVGRWSEDRAWELELVHHKIYLDDPPAGVQRFSISDGFNIVTLNRAGSMRRFIWRFGVGLVVTHPESTVRNKPFDESKGILGQGFYISGAAIQGAVGKRIFLWKGLFASIEGKLTVSFVRVPIVEGHADVPNVAGHILLGLGYQI